MSDFSLVDAIECGIVKLPPCAGHRQCALRRHALLPNLWERIRTKTPKQGRRKAAVLDPLDLPPLLQTALQALYGHYKKTFNL